MSSVLRAGLALAGVSEHRSRHLLNSISGSQARSAEIGAIVGAVGGFFIVAIGIWCLYMHANKVRKAREKELNKVPSWTEDMEEGKPQQGNGNGNGTGKNGWRGNGAEGRFAQSPGGAGDYGQQQKHPRQGAQEGIPRAPPAARRSPIEYLKWTFTPGSGHQKNEKGVARKDAVKKGERDLQWELGHPWMLDTREPPEATPAGNDNWTDKLKSPGPQHQRNPRGAPGASLPSAMELVNRMVVAERQRAQKQGAPQRSSSGTLASIKSQPRSVHFLPRPPGARAPAFGAEDLVRAPLPMSVSVGGRSLGAGSVEDRARRDSDAPSVRRPSSSASNRGLGLQVWPSAAAVPVWLRESLGLDPNADLDGSGQSPVQTYTTHQWGTLRVELAQKGSLAAAAFPPSPQGGGARGGQGYMPFEPDVTMLDEMLDPFNPNEEGPYPERIEWTPPVRNFVVEPPIGSSSRAPAGEEGEQGQAEESAVAPAESLDLMQNRLPKLKGLRISTATAETRL